MNHWEPGRNTLRPNRARAWVAAAFLALVTACTGSGNADSDSHAPSADVDLDGLWRLSSAEMQGRDFTSPHSADLTLAVSDAASQAHAGCMVAEIDPQVSGDSIKLVIASTGNMLSCPPQTKQTAWDQTYLDAVAAVDHGERSGGELELTGPDIRLTYVKVEAD